MVDPPRDAWRVIAVAEARGWRLTHVVETHVHNDYLSGALELRAALGAEILAPARGRYAFAHRGDGRGRPLEVGGLRLVARATPGHTPEHLAWESWPTARRHRRRSLTGGSLLVGSAGRTDLLGPDPTDELTRAQFRSLRALAALPDDVAVLPTHGPAASARPGRADGRRTSTIGQERRCNPLLAIDRRGAPSGRRCSHGLGPYPTYYARDGPDQPRRPGGASAGRPCRRRSTPDAVRTAVAAGAHVVDGRPRDAVRRRATSRAHSTSSSTRVVRVVRRLVRAVRSDRGAGPPRPARGRRPTRRRPSSSGSAMTGSRRARWRRRRLGRRRGGTSRPTRRRRRQRPPTSSPVRRDAYLLDVRYPHEWRDDGTVPGAIELSIGDLAARLDTLPRDAPITVMCKSGSRASIAASMLDAAGFESRLIAIGGAPDLPRRPPTRHRRRRPGRPDDVGPDGARRGGRTRTRRGRPAGRPTVIDSCCRPAGTAGRRRTWPGCRSVPQPVGARERGRAQSSTPGRGSASTAGSTADRGWLAGRRRGPRDRPPRLVGARPGEVTTLNTLTINLHLLLAAFFRPTADGRRSSSTRRRSRPTATPSTRSCGITASTRPTDLDRRPAARRRGHARGPTTSRPRSTSIGTGSPWRCSPA